MSDTSGRMSISSMADMLGTKKKLVIGAVAAVVVIAIAIAGFRYMENKRQEDFEKSYESGMTAFRNGNMGDATIRLKKAVELNPKDYQARAGLAQSYSSEGKIAEAQKQYEESIALNAQQPEILYNLGVIYKSQNKFDKAIDAFTKAKEQNKSLYPADLMRAVCYRESGEPDKAIAIFSQVIKEKPFGANLGDIYVELGLAFQAKNDAKSAKAQWAQALKIDPKNAKAKQLLAVK